MQSFLSEDGFLRFPLTQREIPPKLKEALLHYEDRYFYQHFGINPLSIVRAIWFNLHNQRTIGASTLTMQLARMMHHKPRTLTNKLIEIFMALQLEYHYTKEEILTYYLSNAPYGGNIEGIASASFAYFGLPLHALSLAQLSYLVAIPKNPNRNRPKDPKRIEQLKAKVLQALYSHHALPRADYLRAIAETITPKRTPLPHYAPHLSRQLNGQGEVATTIDLPLQSAIAHHLKQRITQLRPHHIYNGAVVVIDNHTMEIVAYVGSQDFDDSQHAGQIDGVRAVCSPGSTLKPFVYAKALEAGLITPLKKLYDLPLFLAGYQPLNYNKRFLGEVTATEALQLSLNIPAVELDHLLHDASLYHLLKQAKIPTINHPKSYYGASLVLGGCGMTLLSLAELFATVANQGVYQHATALAHQPPPHRTRLLTPQSSYLVTKMLADAPRVEYSSSWEYLQSGVRVAFKTGTSAHAKDLLTIGYTPEYTVAVWYGNFDGHYPPLKEAAVLTGLKVASPTLFRIFRLLKPTQWFVKPEGIAPMRICQDTLQIGACQSAVADEVIVGVTPKPLCEIMRATLLSTTLKHRELSSLKSLESHPCYPIWQHYKPLISAPINHQIYTQNGQLPPSLKKVAFECYTYESNSTLYWLIDQQAPIKGVSGERYYHYLSEGKHQIGCLDCGAKIRWIEVEMEEL